MSVASHHPSTDVTVTEELASTPREVLPKIESPAIALYNWERGDVAVTVMSVAAVGGPHYSTTKTQHAVANDMAWIAVLGTQLAAAMPPKAEIGAMPSGSAS